ncbi:transposase [Asticcacaulis taihuensis]|uniref:Transposase n=1 Tax=Asticcacaulis taihuensis TaxID=260084 RepID=A0A1G4SEE2_9CAUL|nr:transposase [Asticcacaulis taihuensis]
MARMEIITGGGRRRRWPDEDKVRVLEEAAQPGVRLSDVARRHDILPQQIRRWSRQLFGEVKALPEPQMFAPVTLVEAGTPSTPSGRSSKPRPVIVEISLRNGRVLKVAADLERQGLASLIACVEAA